jgi:hypothetical protein
MAGGDVKFYRFAVKGLVTVISIISPIGKQIFGDHPSCVDLLNWRSGFRLQLFHNLLYCYLIPDVSCLTVAPI